MTPTPDAGGATSVPPAEGQSAQANGSTHAEPGKPITIILPDDILKKLKIIAIMRSTSVSEVLADAALSVVKRDLKKVLGKLSE